MKERRGGDRERPGTVPEKVKMKPFLALMRTEETAKIMRRHSDFALISHIAWRARRQDEKEENGLKTGEAFIGDWKEIGFPTRDTYRGSLGRLIATNKITTRTTNRGTIARLVNTGVYNINSEEEPQQIPQQIPQPFPSRAPAEPQQSPTNKNVKNSRREELEREGEAAGAPILEPMKTTDEVHEVLMRAEKLKGLTWEADYMTRRHWPNLSAEQVMEAARECALMADTNASQVGNPMRFWNRRLQEKHVEVLAKKTNRPAWRGEATLAEEVDDLNAKLFQTFCTGRKTRSAGG